MRRRHRWMTCGLAGAALACSLAWGQVPDLSNFQGVLRDSNQVPLTGDHAMTFRFFDDEAAGSEILIDSHAVVSVDNGLFNVPLGSGVVTDGSGVFPGDPYVSLIQMFRDFGTVWIQLEVDGETLLPRSRVVSAPYAMNASTLEGLGSGDFLDTSAVDQTKSGGLTLGSLDVNGVLRMTADGLTTIRFFDNGDPNAESFRWDKADSVFEMSAGLQTDGAIWIGDTINLPLGYNRIGSAGAPNGGNISTVNDLFIADSVEANGDVYFSGSVLMDNDGPDGDQNLWFWNDGAAQTEVLKWDDGADRFEFSNALAISESLRVGGSVGTQAPYSVFQAFGGSPDSDDMNGTQDVYIEGDLEVDDALYLNSELIMLDLDDSGADVDQFIFFYDDLVMDNEWLMWENDDGTGADRFEFSDSVHVGGTLSALEKNFVQSHPFREDLQITYTTLEGDEAAVFTRGSGVLVDGIAHIELGETFRLVANPDVGLTAHLTPRGGAADLYVEQLSPSAMTVGSRDVENVSFDYAVYGLRIGYEEAPALRPRTIDAPVPTSDRWERLFDSHPELRATSALERHQEDHLERHGAYADLSAARALRGRMQSADPEEPRSKRRDVSREPAHEESRHSPDVAPGPVEQPVDATPSAAGTPSAVELAFDSTAGPQGAEKASAVRLWDVSEPVTTGDVVVVDVRATGAFRPSTRPADRTVIGIVGLPAEPASSGTPLERYADRAPIATSGIVICKADASFAAIEPGDLLVTAETPGHVMRATNPIPGTVVAKALEPLPAGTGVIRVLVTSR